MADNQRRRRYLTISILHIITIMCQGNLSFFLFNSCEFFLSSFSRSLLVKFMKRMTSVGDNLDDRNLPFYNERLRGV